MGSAVVCDGAIHIERRINVHRTRAVGDVDRSGAVVRRYPSGFHVRSIYYVVFKQNRIYSYARTRSLFANRINRDSVKNRVVENVSGNRTRARAVKIQNPCSPIGDFVVIRRAIRSLKNKDGP